MSDFLQLGKGWTTTELGEASVGISGGLGHDFDRPCKVGSSLESPDFDSAVICCRKPSALS
jgi:hypothetical protein